MTQSSDIQNLKIVHDYNIKEIRKYMTKEQIDILEELKTGFRRMNYFILNKL